MRPVPTHHHRGFTLVELMISGAITAFTIAVVAGTFTSQQRGMEGVEVARTAQRSAQRIGEIVAGRRAITADTDLRLCRYFGLSNGYWLRAQAAHDTEVAAKAIAAELKRIKPWAGSAA